MPFDAVGVGLCAWDRILLFDRYPELNQKVEAIAGAAAGGGPVPTALAAFSKLGARAAFIGVVGDDPEGGLVREDLRRFGVDVSNLLSRSGQRTPCAHIWVDRNSGERTVALEPGSAEPIKASELPASLIAAAPLLLLDGREAETCLSAAQICRAGGGQVILDAGSPRRNTKELLTVTDHAVVSQDFATGTFPGMNLEQVLVKIAALGPVSVVITCGAEGGLWWEAGEIGRYEAFPVPVVDTTGAGDAFHGGYLFTLKSGYPMQQRCNFASAVAALACRDLGGRAALPTYADVIFMLSSSPTPATPKKR